MSADRNKDAIKRANLAGVPFEWIDCLDCSEYFVRVLRGRNPYVIRCHECRKAQNRVATRERMAHLRDKIQPSVGPEPLTLTNYHAHSGMESSNSGLVEDRMPRGYRSPAGPEHGHTSEFEDLRNSLDLLSRSAAECSWWKNNQHWHDGLGLV